MNIFRRKKKFGCPKCYNENILGFGLDYLESKFESAISFEKKVSDVPLYKCKNCKTSYFIRENSYHRIYDGQIELLQRWGETSFGYSDNFTSEITVIGISQYWDSSYVLPCKIELNDGREFDFATVRLSDQPALGDFYINYENIFFIDEVKSINQSEFALSKDVRSACRSAEESRMGFYPTVVKNKFYFEAVLTGFSLFFDFNGIKGSDLELANKKWNDDNKNIFDLSKESKTLILVKE